MLIKRLYFMWKTWANSCPICWTASLGVVLGAGGGESVPLLDPSVLFSDTPLSSTLGEGMCESKDSAPLSTSRAVF